MRSTSGERRRNHERARRALGSACEALCGAARGLDGTLPGLLPAGGLAEESIREVACWLGHQVRDLPSPRDREGASAAPVGHLSEDGKVLDTLERLAGLVRLRPLHARLHRIGSARSEDLERALGAGSRRARLLARLAGRLAALLDGAGRGESAARAAREVEGVRALRRSVERLQEEARRVVRSLEETHPSAAWRLRWIQGKVVRPLLDLIREIERMALPEGAWGAGEAGAGVHADISALLGEIRGLEDSLDPVRLVRGRAGAADGPRAAGAGGRGGRIAAGSRSRWRMAPYLFLRLFDDGSPRTARVAVRVLDCTLRLLQDAHRAGRLSSPPPGEVIFRAWALPALAPGRFFVGSTA